MKGILNKVVCLTIALACVTITADAQVYRRGDYRRGRSTSSYRHARGRGYDVYGNYTGLRLGANIASLSFDGTSGVSKDPLTGLNLGVVGGVEVTPYAPIFFESGLLYTQKGVKGSKGGDDLKVNMHYLEVPLVFKYNIGIESGLNYMSVQPFFGGFASVGFAGKTKDFSTHEKVNTFSDRAFSNLDAGLRMGCGFQFEHLYLEVSYDWGLANVARNNFNHLGYDNFDDKIHTSTLSGTVGLNF